MGECVNQIRISIPRLKSDCSPPKVPLDASCVNLCEQPFRTRKLACLQPQEGMINRKSRSYRSAVVYITSTAFGTRHIHSFQLESFKCSRGSTAAPLSATHSSLETRHSTTSCSVGTQTGQQKGYMLANRRARTSTPQRICALQLTPTLTHARGQ